MEENIHITVLDTSFTIKCPIEKIAALKEAAAFLHNNMQDLKDSGMTIDKEKIAYIAALNATYDLLQQKTQNASRIHAMNDRLLRLQEQLEDLIPS